MRQARTASLGHTGVEPVPPRPRDRLLELRVAPSSHSSRFSAGCRSLPVPNGRNGRNGRLTLPRLPVMGGAIALRQPWVVAAIEEPFQEHVFEAVDLADRCAGPQAGTRFPGTSQEWHRLSRDHDARRRHGRGRALPERDLLLGRPGDERRRGGEGVLRGVAGVGVRRPADGGAGDLLDLPAAGRAVAGLYDRAETPGWGSYISVDDVDGATGRARELGAEVLVEPFDTPGGGGWRRSGTRRGCGCRCRGRVSASGPSW